MRPYLLTVISVFFALPAFAQDATTGTVAVPIGQVVQTSPVAAPVIVPPNTGATIVTSPGNKITQVAPKVQLEDIGFDPKVKRDPNGKVIQPTTGAQGQPIDAHNLRTDSSTSLRSDMNVYHPPIPQPVAPTVPVVAHPAATVVPGTTVINPTVTVAQPTSTLPVAVP